MNPIARLPQGQSLFIYFLLESGSCFPDSFLFSNIFFKTGYFEHNNIVNLEIILSFFPSVCCYWLLSAIVMFV